MVPTQYLRNVVVDARHRDPADADLRAKAGVAAARGHHGRRAFQEPGASRSRSLGTSGSSRGGTFPGGRPRPESSTRASRGSHSGKRRSIARTKWMLERLERSEGLATIYPAMMNSIFAMLAEGGDTTDPLVAREIGSSSDTRLKTRTRCACSRAFRRFGTRRLRWCRSKKRGSIPAHPSLVAAARWLLESDSRARRLAGEESQRGAGRLGIRVSQRFLPRCGRYRVRADGD